MSHQQLPPDSPARCFACHHPLPPISLPPVYTPPDPSVFTARTETLGVSVPGDAVAPINPTPEASTVLLVGTVLVGVGWWLQRQRA